MTEDKKIKVNSLPCYAFYSVHSSVGYEPSEYNPSFLQRVDDKLMELPILAFIIGTILVWAVGIVGLKILFIS